MTIARTRIRRIRLKSGGEIVPLLRPEVDEAEQALLFAMRGLAETMRGDVAGFAIVVWGNDTSSAAELRRFSGPLPLVSAPEFVRARLAALIAERWTLQSIEGG